MNNNNMKSPWPKVFLIAVIVILLIVFVAPKVIEIFNDNIDETGERASNS